jgi:hypothetical protein
MLPAAEIKRIKPEFIEEFYPGEKPAEVEPAPAGTAPNVEAEVADEAEEVESEEEIDTAEEIDEEAEGAD